ncbi:MAG: response regulator [Acetobacteraceae bacterium]|nr:response regulator [Acetobacteraceae bacterium]
MTDKNETINILIVDDEIEIIDEISEYFASVGIVATTAMNVDAAIEALGSLPAGSVTVVLTDIRMPGRDGLALAEYIRDSMTEASAIELVVMTGHGNFGLALNALRAHVFDFINKPAKLSELLNAVHQAHKSAMTRRARAMEGVAAMTLASRNDDLERRLQRGVSDKAAVQDVTLHVLSYLVEIRDVETGNHIRRTQEYAGLLMRLIRQNPRFAAELADDRYCDLIVKAVPLHDIGKVGIPDSILLKPGPLTPEEFTIMKTHTTIGAQAISAALQRVSRDHPESGDDSMAFLDVARQIAVSHHEKWNGSGYPGGLAGDAIPLPGRLMALADVFDALSSERPYKLALPLDQATDIIAAGRGTHFDPDLVDAFLAHRDAFAEIAMRLKPETQMSESDAKT